MNILKIFKKKTRYCPICKQTKSIYEFNKRQNYCKICFVEYVTKWQKENPDKIKEYNKKYGQKNLD